MTDSGWPSPPQDTENCEANQPQHGGTALLVGNPTPSPRGASARLRLSTIGDCKREIRRNYIRAQNGEISTTEAGKFVWIISTLANLISEHEIEDRVSALELATK
jgi:hypothetical protein